MPQKHLILILARELASNLATPTLILDAEGTLIFFNEAAEEIVGGPFADIGEIPMSEFSAGFAPRTRDNQPLPEERRPAQEAPDAVSAQIRERDGRRYGHLRLWTFDVPDVLAFVNEVVATVAELDDTDGLIVDVRGNGGGDFAAGERLLQLFTPWRIEPERVQFLTTDGTRAIAARDNSNFKEWRKSLRRAPMCETAPCTCPSQSPSGNS